MDSKNLITLRCASCDGKGIPEILRPYCSVFCRAIGPAGLGWRTNPYRIVDLKSETRLSSGPGFDITIKGIAELRKSIENLQEKAGINSPDSRVKIISSPPINITSTWVDANV